MKIQNLSSTVLHEKLVSISSAERKLTLELLHHLQEFDRRKLYAERGHPSLFEYVVHELKYSESAAQRRIFAMRALRDLPELEEQVRSGELKVTQLAQVQSFLRMEQKQGKRFTVQEKKELIESTLGKSTRETERLLAEKNPDFALREKTRAVTATHTQITFTADEKLMQNLAQVRDRFAHRLPAGASIADIIQFLAGHALTSLPEAKLAPAKAKTEKTIAVPEEKIPPLPAPVVNEKGAQGANPLPEIASRYIPVATRKAVWKRDQGQCTYTSKETGKKCGSTHRLQIDHIRPYALEGLSTSENLRLLCFAHNQAEARRIFGQARHSSAKLKTDDYRRGHR